MVSLYGSLVDAGWYWLNAVLNFSVSNGPRKKSNSTQFILGFLSRENLLQPVIHWYSGGRDQVWVQLGKFEELWAPACHLEITPEGYSRSQSKGLTAKWPSSWGSTQALWHSFGWSDWRAQTQGVSMSAAVTVATTGSLEENVLSLLQYWLSLRVKKV